jgi:predicted nuclease of restriction endonuclease-like RecB superfamily
VDLSGPVVRDFLGSLMLTGDLVRVRTSKERIVPLFLNRNSSQWLEAAESLLAVFREGVGITRGEIEEEINDLFGGGGKATLVHRGLAKVLEDRAEFEVVADVPPDQIREKVFTAAALARGKLRLERQGQEQRVSLSARAKFPRDAVMAAVAEELGLTPEIVMKSLFADLRDENRLLKFEDIPAQRLIDRYNVALAQAVLLRSVRVVVEIRNEGPARYRQLFRRLKFHRLLWRVQGSMAGGYSIQIDGPLSLFSATTRYGLQMAMFLPAVLHCDDYRLDSELRWGPRREPRSFHLDGSSGLISHQLDSGLYVPAEIPAFVERFRQVAPAWEMTEFTDVLELGREGVWVPDYRAVHKATGTDIFIEVLGFWKKSSLERLLRLLPSHGPPRFVLAISEKMKVDEGALSELPGPILRFKEIPIAQELLTLLETFVKPADLTRRLF